MSKNTAETVDLIDEASAAETLKPGAGSGGTESKAQTLAAFSSLLSQLGKEDLSKLFNDAQAVFGPNKAPGAVDNSAKNKASIATKGAVKEDVEEMFSGDELSEDLKEKAVVVFEAAVEARCIVETARLEEEFEQQLDEAVAEIQEEITAKVDQYLDYVIEQWIEDNKIAIESSLRAEIAEEFMGNLHKLFVESNINVPDEQIDVLGEMTAKVEELESKLDESVNKQLELQAVIDEAEKEAVFDEVSEGLAATQVEKLRTLAEGIDYVDADTYKKKLDIVKETYFADKRQASTATLVDESEETLTEEAAPVPADMAKYVSTISRTLK
jgi:hypothetical protein